MKVDIRQKITGFDGKPIAIDGQQGRDLSYLLLLVLTFESPEFVVTGSQKIRNFELCVQLSQSDEVELTVEDITYIKQAGEEILTILTYGQLVKALEV